jgi:hypothetical protein
VLRPQSTREGNARCWRAANISFSWEKRGSDVSEKGKYVRKRKKGKLSSGRKKSLECASVKISKARQTESDGLAFLIRTPRFIFCFNPCPT